MVHRASLKRHLYLGLVGDVFLTKYYPVSKNLNNKDKVNNFMELPRESVSISWEKFTAFVRGVPKYRIDDESLKEYFYRGQDEKNKVVLDIIAGGSYRECMYAEFLEKLEKISHNNKVWSTRASNTWKNTCTVQATNNPTTDEMHEWMAQLRTE